MKKLYLTDIMSVLMIALTSCGQSSDNSELTEVQQRAQELVEETSKALEESNKELDETIKSIYGGNSEESVPHIQIAVGEHASSEKFKMSFLDAWTQDKISMNEGNNYQSASDGYIYMIVAINIENCSSATEEIWPLSHFVGYADNILYTTNVERPFDSLDRIKNYNSIADMTAVGGITLQSGRSIEGYYGFEIPADTETFEMEFDEFVLTCDILH